MYDDGSAESSEKMTAQVHLTLKYCGKMAKL